MNKLQIIEQCRALCADYSQPQRIKQIAAIALDTLTAGPLVIADLQPAVRRDICQQMGVKFCTGCNRYRDVSMFHQRKASRDGLVARCKDCAAKAGEKWRDENRDFLNMQYEAQRELRAERRRQRNRESMARTRRNETPEQAEERRRKNREAMRKKRKA